MEDNKVKIVSTVDHSVFVSVPELRFKRTWPSKGTGLKIEKGMLEDLMLDAGFNTMIETGTLYIEDLEVKKELGLEPEDAKEPVNIIVLSEKDMKNYWTVFTATNFKDKVKQLNLSQRIALADYAINNKIMNLDKCRILKELCGKDVIGCIRLNEDNATKEEE